MQVNTLLRTRPSLSESNFQPSWQRKFLRTQTRRLTTGSLVAISTAADGFRTICIPAVVANDPIRDGLDKNHTHYFFSNPGRIARVIAADWFLDRDLFTIHTFRGNTDDAVLDPTTESVVLQSRSGCFEVVRHRMVRLQHVASADIPLDKYLVSLDKSDLAAESIWG
ncbi:hypothetical protein F4860DRAFT_235957 [Xylaria cubensis]|nr:hypothetical protein F4860DRAFT_235957 [Xylaria cubensis]